MTGPKTFRAKHDVLLVSVVAGWKLALQIARFETSVDSATTYQRFGAGIKNTRGQYFPVTINTCRSAS